MLTLLLMTGNRPGVGGVDTSRGGCGEGVSWTLSKED